MVGMGRQRAPTESPRERAHRAEQGTLADSRPRASDEDSESATRIVIVRGYPKRANHGVQSPDTAPHTDLHFKSERASLAAARSGDRWGGDWPAGACGQATTRRRAALISVFGGRAFIVRWHTLSTGSTAGPWVDGPLNFRSTPSQSMPATHRWVPILPQATTSVVPRSPRIALLSMA